MLKRSFISAFVVLLVATPVVSADPMDVTPLAIQSGEATHDFSVEVANDPDEISYGLMDRPSMDADKGMLFDFGTPREPAMYMKNTLISLDMLFIRSDGTIEMIARNTVPGSLRTISAGVPVKSVLELNGGIASELGIMPGDKVIHPIFTTDSAAE